MTDQEVEAGAKALATELSTVLTVPDAYVIVTVLGWLLELTLLPAELEAARVQIGRLQDAVKRGRS